MVFYDENGNGILDGQERVRIPNAEVLVGGRSARTVGTTGQTTVDNVPPGSQTASVNTQTLPPYFVPGAAVPVQVPPASGSTVFLPVTLPIGGNRANAYLLFGDSITAGEGSTGGGYGGYLEADLRNYIGQAFIVNEGLAGTKSDRGEAADVSHPRPDARRLHPHPLRHQRLERSRLQDRRPLLHHRAACAA